MAGPIRPDDLLDIDLEAEVRLLSRDQLQGAWLVPAELVRLALAHGARAVDVGSGRRRWWMRAHGAALAPALLEALTVVLDDARAPGDRQAAISDVENAEVLPLLWARAAAETVVVSCVAGGREVRCSLGGTGASVGESSVGDPRSRHLEVELRRPGFDLGRGRWWLATACRFAPVPVRLDEEPLPRGVDGGLYRQRVERPLVGELQLAAEGDSPRLWLLRHGVVASRATVPGYPPFHAAVELGADTPPTASGADLRSAVAPHLGPLIDRAVELMLWAGRRMAERPAGVRRRLRRLLLEAAERGLRRDEVLELPLIEVRKGPRTRPLRLWSLVELAEEARRGGILVIDPDEDAGRVARGGAAVCRLDAEERRLVRSLAGVTTQRPQPPRDDGLRHAWEALAAELSGPLRRVATWLLRAGRGPLDKRRLTQREVALLDGLEALLGSDGSVVMRAGRGWPAWSPGRRLLELPRTSRVVRRGAAAVAADVAWAWPVLVAALHPIPPPPAARSRWRRMLEHRIDRATRPSGGRPAAATPDEG